MNNLYRPESKIMPAVIRKPAVTPAIMRAMQNLSTEQPPTFIRKRGVAPSIMPAVMPSIVPLMSDIHKPKFVINSLDKQNNLDRTQSIGDYKPIPSATFNGELLGKVNPR